MSDLCSICRCLAWDDSELKHKPSVWPPSKQDIEQFTHDSEEFKLTDEEYQKILSGQELEFIDPDWPEKNWCVARVWIEW